MQIAIVLAVGAALAVPPGRPAAVGRLAGSSLDDAVGMIAYAGPGPDRQRSEIYTIRTDGSDRRQLTTNGGSAPAWSPDGMQLAFSRRDAIWVMDSSGGMQRQVAEGADPTWSPDGTRLSYVCRDGNDLCVLDLQTASETVVVRSTAAWPGAGSPTWSPDASWIAFTRYSADGDSYTGYRQLFRVHPDGTGLAEIPNTYPEGDLPSWSPDGETILYTERYDGRGGEYSGDLFSVRPDGTEKVQLTDRIGRDQAGAWSPDGQRIAIESEAGLYPHQAGVWTMDPDGAGRTLVVRNGSGPSWRPHFTVAAAPPPPPISASGRRIAYVAATDAGHDLFTVRPDGTRTRRLTATGGVREPVWSPDHTQIAYVSTSARGTVSLRVIDVGSGKARRVARANFYDGGPAWSPNGRRLAWGGFRELMVLHLGTGELHRIPITADGRCCARDLTWSPDGRWIAFSEELSLGSSDITIVPAKGGPFRHVTRLKGQEQHLDWSPDGQRIVFTRLTGRWWDGVADVWSIRPDGTGLRRVVTTGELDLSPAWSPDGGRLAVYSDGPRPFGATPGPGLWTVGSRGGSTQLVVRDRTIAYVDW